MASDPPKRLYFDTNILWGWPNCSNEIWNIFSVANWLKTELYIPKVVEDELEGQFIRAAWDLIDALKLNLKQLDKHCKHVVQNDITGHFYSEDDLREAFRLKSDQIKQHYGISIVPLTKMTLADLLDMAINRIAPFEQIQIDKNKHGVVGLQDAAILFSIMEHLPQTDDRCILLTADKIFYDPDVNDLLKKSALKLERVRKAGDIWKEFSDHMFAAVRTPWVAEMEQIEADLNTEKERLGREIDSIISLSSFRNRLWMRAKIQTDFKITEFRFIKTDLPDANHLPPRSAYNRPEGSKVPISARATAEMLAYVDRSEWSGIFGAQTDGPSSIPGLDQATLTEYLNVSLEGVVRNGQITDFAVTGVEPSKL